MQNNQSYGKDSPNDMTFATNNRTKYNAADMSVLINDHTSKTGRAVINQLNNEMKKRPDIMNDGSGFLSRDMSGNRSMTLLRNAHSILGASADDPFGVHNTSGATGAMEVSVARPLSGFGAPRLTSALEKGASGIPLIRPQVVHPESSRILGMKNPNSALNSSKLNNEDLQNIRGHWSNMDAQNRAKGVKDYIDTVVKRVEDMETRQKDFRQLDQNTLDAKATEEKKWMSIQKKVDEERRVEIETRLRSIFKEKEMESTGYSPSEGFMLSIDFV